MVGFETTVRRHPWLRGLLALASAILGLMALAASAANVIVKVDPVQAESLSPGNGTIMAAAAKERFASSSGVEKAAQAARVASLAVREDATAVDALLVLAFHAQIAGDQPRSNRIFAHVNRLTRRELQPQIWAIEDAISQGDIERALHHYDIALRTSVEAQAMLYPTLATALAEPRIRSAVLQIVASRPIWTESYFTFLSNRTQEPTSAMQFFQEAREFGIAITEENRAALVNHLFAKGEFRNAFRYYASYRPDVDASRSRDPGFTGGTKHRTVFDWTTGQEPGLSASILANGSQGVVEFSLSPGFQGTLIEQTQILPAGKYRISTSVVSIDQPANLRYEWVLMCLQGPELGRIRIPATPVQGGVPADEFTVPQGCPVQKLAMEVRSTSAASGVTGRIERAELSPSGM